jgi:hypothetical protein
MKRIERTLGSVATLFAQFVAGYTGSSVERRGRRVEDGPVRSVLQLHDWLRGVTALGGVRWSWCRDSVAVDGLGGGCGGVVVIPLTGG